MLGGRVSALVGHSGVGKSTLVNALVPDAARAVGVVSAVGKGRHTTTAALALPLPDERGAGWVVDTPGIRSFGLAHVTPDDVPAAFDDLADGDRGLPARLRAPRPPADPECASTLVAQGRCDPAGSPRCGGCWWPCATGSGTLDAMTGGRRAAAADRHAERTAAMQALDEHLADGRSGVEEYADRSAVARRDRRRRAARAVHRPAGAAPRAARCRGLPPTAHAPRDPAVGHGATLVHRLASGVSAAAVIADRRRGPVPAHPAVGRLPR